MFNRFVRKPAVVLAAVVTVLLLASAAFGAMDGGHADAATLLKDFLYRCLNFSVVVILLAYFLTRPIKKALAARREGLEQALEEARRAKEAAEAKFAEYDRKLKDATAEIDQLQDDIKREGELERDRIIASARAMAEKIGQDAERAASQEVARARQVLRQEAVSLAVGMARDILGKSFTEADQKRLVDEYVQKMQKAGETI